MRNETHEQVVQRLINAHKDEYMKWLHYGIGGYYDGAFSKGKKDFNPHAAEYVTETGWHKVHNPFYQNLTEYETQNESKAREEAQATLVSAYQEHQTKYVWVQEMKEMYERYQEMAQLLHLDLQTILLMDIKASLDKQAKNQCLSPCEDWDDVDV